eukprot:TRINITY_DN15534_c0_g1_i3.p1 TRINITY_DN15534_c0_g1~~TRINITY_DN15534_c0_g1_i3.p1  ORF type:complete len:441 (-),score=45.34 TRINITY_DN15534_c0_g1_i3:440-1720(-)
MVSHWHDTRCASQNCGNVLGTKPCVRQTDLYKRHESGNQMKALLGAEHLVWKGEAPEDRAQQPRQLAGSDGGGFLRRNPSETAWRVCRDGGAADAPETEIAAARHRPASFQPPVRSFLLQPSRTEMEASEDSPRVASPRAAAETAAAAAQPAAVDAVRQKRIPERAHRGRGGGAVAPPAAKGMRRSASTGSVPAERPGARPSTSTPQRHKAAAPTSSPKGYVSPPPRRARPASATPPRPSDARSQSRGGCGESSSSCSTPTRRREPMRTASTPATPKLSKLRFDSMPASPAFSSGGGASSFAQRYNRGELPCRIDHGAYSLRISWDIPTAELLDRRDELLIVCAEGLRESRHPYATVARLAFAGLVGSSTYKVSQARRPWPTRRLGRSWQAFGLRCWQGRLAASQEIARRPKPSGWTASLRPPLRR